MSVRFIPLAQAALQLSVSPERMRRLITTHRVAGAFREGRWLAVEADVARLLREGLADQRYPTQPGSAR